MTESVSRFLPGLMLGFYLTGNFDFGQLRPHSLTFSAFSLGFDSFGLEMGWICFDLCEKELFYGIR